MARDRSARPEARPLRLFVAVDIPPSAKRALEEAAHPWRDRLPKGRWVHPDNWHVTLKFLGRTWPRLVSWVQERSAEAAKGIRPFRVSLEGLGVFPGPSRARVVWAGLKDEDAGLVAVARALDEGLGDEFPPEKRAFTPHLTIARLDPPVQMRGHASDLSSTRIDAAPFRVTRLVLYQSHLSPRGARYEPLGEYPLRG